MCGKCRSEERGISGVDPVQVRATELSEKANKFALAVMALRRGIGVKP